MTTENPERLWAFVCDTTRSQTDLYAFWAEGQAVLVRDTTFSPYAALTSPIAPYLREDVAARQTAAVVQAERDAGREALRRLGDTLMEVQREVTALRAEVEALRSLAKRAADLLRPSLRLTVDGRDTPPNALAADIDAALAKGVG